jgi:[ribosomal protein S18]-alanine N-acetyltransferase
VRYRLFCPEDFAKLYAIEERCFEPVFRFSRPLMRELVSASESATWIAWKDESMAGFVIVSWAMNKSVLIAYIQTIEVTPEFRGQGIAEELLRYAENSACVAGAEWIWLHVSASNAAAIGLYRKNGYMRRGLRKNFYPQGGAALVYAKLLDDASAVDRSAISSD